MLSSVCWRTSAYLLVSLSLKNASHASASLSDASPPQANLSERLSSHIVTLEMMMTHPNNRHDYEAAFCSLNELRNVRKKRRSR
jgi:hypothetical protein